METMQTMPAIESQYVAAYRNVVRAMSNVNAYVTPALRNQIDALEATLSRDRIEQLREVARV